MKPIHGFVVCMKNVGVSTGEVKRNRKHFVNINGGTMPLLKFADRYSIPRTSARRWHKLGHTGKEMVDMYKEFN